MVNPSDSGLTGSADGGRLAAVRRAVPPVVPPVARRLVAGRARWYEAGPALAVLLLLSGAQPRALAGAPPTFAAQTAGVARVVRDLAPVYEGQGDEYPLVWRLYEGSQVAVGDEATGADGQFWRQVRLWNSQDGWLAADALSFEPYPPPPAPTSAGQAGGESGPCRPRTESQPYAEELAATGTVLAATDLAAAPDDDAGLGAPAPGARIGELPPGASVSVLGWGVAADGRVRYRVSDGSATGWAAPGAVTLDAADPPTRVVGGQPIVAPLRGKGIWYVLDSREQGTTPAARVVAAARANGLSHLYVEVATSRGGFWGARWLDDLLPAARAAGLRVIGSVYVCLDNLPADLALSLAVARYRTPDGLALDGLTADVEQDLVAPNVAAYGELLRHFLGDDYLLVATVYPPESWYAPRYPWPALTRSWNAVAPMAYWRQQEQRAFSGPEAYAYVQRNLDKLRALVGRADLPVEVLGQAFDAGHPRLLGPDSPTADEVAAAIRAARDGGAVGISFFDWTRATPAQWAALAAGEW